LSRNKLIIQALEREVTAGADWPPEFFERLATVEPELCGLEGSSCRR
jgi:hypothetical protein